MIEGTLMNLKFLIPVGWENRLVRMAFAERHGLGVEVTAFVGGAALNDSNSREAMELEFEKLLSEFKGTKTMHGAFLDLAIHSPDKRVASLSQSRIEQDLITATRLGCEKLIVHLGFNPLVPVSRYRRQVIEAHAGFWEYALAAYRAITVCVENLWEPDWRIFGDLFEEVQHPRFGLCLDVAHAHVHSHYGPEAWIRNMATHIFHLHWNDNCGDRDSHLPLGAGNIDWPVILNACRVWKEATVTLEMNEMMALRRSLAFLNRTGARHPLPPLCKSSAVSASGW